MIRVTIELVVHGDENHERNRKLGILTIVNDGTGTAEVGNYSYELSHAGKFFGKKGAFKKGRVIGFGRHLSPYRLVQRCLKHAREV